MGMRALASPEVEQAQHWARSAVQTPLLEQVAQELERNPTLARKGFAWLARAIQKGMEVGGMVGAPQVGVTTAIPAYHGSPYKFEKFKNEAIGSGEGAQSYGYGHYVAESPRVARSYAESVKDMGQIQDLNAKMSAVSKEMNKYEIPGRYQEYRDPRGYQLRDEYDRLMRQREELVSSKGNVYSVSLEHPELKGKKPLVKDDLLDWDSPIGDQGEPLRGSIVPAFRELMIPTGVDYDGTGRGYTGRELYRELVTHFAQRWENAPDNPMKAASEKLAEIGIPGIKYRDQLSRGGRPKYTGDSAWLAAAEDFKKHGYSSEDAFRGLSKAYRGGDAKALRAAVDEVYDIKPPESYNFVMFDPAYMNIVGVE